MTNPALPGDPPGNQLGPLVVSLVPRTLAGLERALSARVHRGSDVLEVRLDFIAEELQREPTSLQSIFASAARPVIAALHGSEGFGTFDGTPKERAAALLAARAAGAAYLDLDASLVESVGDLGGPLIISTHGPAPEAAALSDAAARADALRRSHLDRVKLVPACQAAREGLAVLEWLSSRPPGGTVAFGSGEVARFTRMLAPAFGSALVYAAPFELERDFGAFDLVPAAPGQVSVGLLRRVWPQGGPTCGPGPKTSIAAVCGVPIDHSAGPVVHGAACRAAGLDAMLVPVAPDALADLWAFPAVAARLAGLSVTAPFKGDAVHAAAECDGATRAMGAANTLVKQSSAGGSELGWLGRNTDAPAVARSFEAAGAKLKGAEALVIGAGGAARAAAFALAEGGAKVTVAARSLPKAAALAEDLGRGLVAVTLDGPEYRALRPDLIVHATPLGTGGHGCPPIDAAMVRPGSWTMDAVYKPRRTELLRRVEAWGGGALPGDGWFLGQAWLQHLMIFEARYRALGLTPGADPDLAERMQESMEAAFEWWGTRHGLGAASSGRSSGLKAQGVMALLGLRGAGKTTVGREAAQLLGARWIDLDEEVAKAGGQGGAASVIEREGLLRFRLRESAALARALDRSTADFEASGQLTIISTGGGVVESERAAALLERAAFTVWLRAPFTVLAARVAADAADSGPAGGALAIRPDARPAIVPGAAAGSVEEFAYLAARRDPVFDRVADAVVRVDELSVSEVVQRVVERWQRAR